MIPVLTKIVFHNAEAMCELDDAYAVALDHLLLGQETDEDKEVLVSTLESQLSDGLILFPHEVEPSVDNDGHVTFTGTVMRIRGVA